MSRLSFNERSHRYKLDGKAVQSVTGLLGGGIPKPRLMYWYAKKTAGYAASVIVSPSATKGYSKEVTEHSDITEYPVEDIVDELKKAPTVEKNKAALRGTNVHMIAEDLLNAGVDEYEVPEYITEEEFEYVQQALAFLDDFQITHIYSELLVFSDEHNYAGKFDAIVESALYPGERILLDFKTSNGLYPEVALQLAAYRHADFIVINDEDVPMKEMGVTQTWGVHIQPDYYKVYELDSSEETYGKFLSAVEVARFSKTKEMNQLIIKELEKP